MNKKFFAGALLLAGTVFAVRGQSTFQNLGFEAAQNLPVTSGAGATANLLPGWQAFSGVSELSAIAYNLFTAVPEVGLYSSLPIAGNLMCCYPGVVLSAKSG